MPRNITIIIILVLSVACVVNFDASSEQAASTPFRNIQILTGASVEEVHAIMEVTSITLGVECEYCHESTVWHLDTRESKVIARRMMEMVVVAGSDYFEGFEMASCWTCHRGSTKPQKDIPEELLSNFTSDQVAPFSDDIRPAREVYTNVDQLGDIPANQLAEVMFDFAASLGVSCTHCHDNQDWASDGKIAKLMARRMIEISNGMEKDFFDGRRVMTCWTCHRGKLRAETNMPRDLVPPFHR